MRNSITIFFLAYFFMIANANAVITDCFLVKSGDKKIISEGRNCSIQYSPASTFKIPLAIIGYESGILKNENHPIWKSPKNIDYLKEVWSGEKTPSSWMRYSIVWYSQILTKKLGMKKFQFYVDKLDYGNKNLSGNSGKNDGLTQAWLSSSLLISPTQQINFIEKLAKNELPFSKKSLDKTKNLIRLFDESLLSNGWKLYGKTGTDVDVKEKMRKGYFVGFAEKNNEIITFVIHISGDETSKVSGIFAKKIAIDRLMKEVFSAE